MHVSYFQTHRKRMKREKVNAYLLCPLASRSCVRLLLSSPPSSICQLTFYLRSDSPSPYAYGKCVLRFETKFNPDWNPPNPISLHPSHSLLRRFQRARFIKYSLSPSFLFEHLRKWTTLRNGFSFLFYLSILIKPNRFFSKTQREIIFPDHRSCKKRPPFCHERSE